MQKHAIAVVCALAIIGGVSRRAEAQTFLTPYVGSTFGKDAPEKSLTTGLGLTFMGKAAGFEVDFGYTPDFFGETSDVVLVADSNVTTFTGNLLVGIGAGPIRPYVLGGVGLLRTRIDVDDVFADISRNNWGVSFGGGVMGMTSDHIGFRGDVRYMRSLQDPTDDDDFDLAIGNFDFWRGTAGVVLRF